MKRILLLSAVACSLIFYGCKKDDTTDNSDPVIEIPKPAIDPVTLASNIKVGYSATKDTGAIPAASADAGAPVLDTRYDNLTYTAINNRYVVIRPQSLSGAVKGFYLKINGANARFKIDYSTAYNLRKANGHSFLREGDNSDSSIVIKLPAGLKGDTFSVKYAAYDSLNRVSNSINAIVSIVASADSTDNNALSGTWKITRYEIAGQDFPIARPDSSDFSYYTCEDNVLVPGGNENDLEIANSIMLTDLTFQFGAKNVLKTFTSYITSSFVENESSCSNLVYNTTTEIDPHSQNELSYSYNAATKIITMVNDYNGTGNNLTAIQYTVTTLTSNKLMMYTIYFETDYHDQVITAHFDLQKSAN
jgi:hypothetical protein